VLIYDDEHPPLKSNLTHVEFYGRAVEIFVTTLSAMTREGNLYRVDLRLRPDGKNGATSLGKKAFLDYLQNRSAVWEWLAYVKLRAAGGDLGLGEYVEREARRVIHRQARAADRALLRDETLRIRERLEEAKANGRKGREIDIKFGAGGMLDVYFATRYLQLRDDLPDDEGNRSTDHMLGKLHDAGSLSPENYEHFRRGYDFLSALDHHLRLAVGRSTRLPFANQKALEMIAARLDLGSVGELLEQLTVHRLNIRAAFEKILET
jgi:[glutamine synthetase] adenylyltransferase / [glutamine synthetase]-adenylyl-L-tyrosine phosphorylase